MNRRGLLKTILGAVGLGALAPIVKAAPKAEPELDPVGLMDDFCDYLDRTGQTTPILDEGTPMEFFTDFNHAPGPIYLQPWPPVGRLGQ